MTPAEKTSEWLNERLREPYTTRLWIHHGDHADAHLVLIVDQPGEGARLPMFDDHVVCVLGVHEEPRDQ